MPFPSSHPIRRFIATFAAAFCLCLPGHAATTPEGKTLEASKTPVQIAAAGKAMVPIVISPEASEAVRKTAAELAAYLKRITGAEFAIQQGTEAKGITLGTLAQFPDENLKEPMAVKEGCDGVEAFAIRTDGGRIRLLGNTDLGAEHAAYRFLELLGCRWFFEGENWEIIPETRTLSFDLNECDRPQILSRYFAFSRIAMKGEEDEEDRGDVYREWRKANRMSRSLEINTKHSWHAIPNAFKDDGYPYKKEFEAHPEYFALVDGERKPPQLCVSNAGFQKLVVQYANRYFEKNPDADMLPLDTADGNGWCMCGECAKLGPPGAQAFYLANLVAKELQTTHPGKVVGLNAYNWHSDPPDFALEPNVFVMLTNGMNASKHSFDELFKMWSERCSRMGIYDYFSFWQMDHCMLPGKGPHNKLDDFGPRIKRYVDHKVIAITGDASNSWGVHGLGYYLGAKMMWDPTGDTKALKRDFYDKAFGPAAPAMERYYERLNLSNIPFRGVTLLRQCLGDLEEATTLANSRPDVLARLDDLKANMVYNYLGQKVDDAKNDADEKNAALEWFTWAYRTRNNHMTDWMTFRAVNGNDKFEPSFAFRFKEPSWYYKNTRENPWKNDEPVTSKELAGLLQKIKEEWGGVPAYEEKKYSDQFVLVELDHAGKPENKLAFQGTAVQLLASPKGEALSFKVGSIPSPKHERQDAKYTLATPDGREILAGELPEGDSNVELKVPGPGIYTFQCRRGGAGWKMELPDGLDSALVVKRDVEFRPQSITAYFYVPKGTSQITTYIQDGTATVLDPASRVAFKGRANGKFIVLPVEKGMDGKVWSINGKFRNLWFLDIPTVLSSSSDRIFVPKEVAEKDGLKVVL